jgi:hypothetical protein
MAKQLFSNNAASTTSAALTTTATTVALVTNGGSDFPAISGGDWFMGTLVDANGVIEIVKVTARTGDSLTVVRGQEGTTANVYPAGSRFELRLTASALETLRDEKAPLASPALTGVPTAPTAAAGTNTTQIATTAHVKTAIDNLIGGAPAALDTLNELAAALADDASYATTVTNALATKANQVTTISAGAGLTGGGDLSTNRTISHADTSSQASVNNAGNTFIQDITLDTYGHITGLTSATAVINDATITMSAGSGLSGGGSFTANQGTAGTITFSHADTSSQASVDNTGNTFIQDITLDTYGHITAISSGTAVINDATMTVSAGNGLTGGGNFTANQSANSTVTLNVGAGTGIAVAADTVSLSHLGIQSLTDPNADRIMFWDDSAGAMAWLSAGTNVSISGTTISSSYVNTTYSAGTGITLTGTTFSIPQAVATSSNVQFAGLGVGTAGAAGEVRATGQITAYYSDMRLKDVVVDQIPNAVAKCQYLTGFKYKASQEAIDLNIPGLDPDRVIAGLSAQAVRDVLPEAIRPAPFDTDADGNSISGQDYLTVQYEQLIPVLVEAIKELASEIEVLRNLIETQE